MRKRVWARPELVVLAKSTPGEDILTVCKSINHSQTFLDGTVTTGHNCMKKHGNCGACLDEGGTGS